MCSGSVGPGLDSRCLSTFSGYAFLLINFPSPNVFLCYLCHLVSLLQICVSNKKAMEVDLSHGNIPVRKIMNFATDQDSLKYLLQRPKTLFRCCIGAKLVKPTRSEYPLSQSCDGVTHSGIGCQQRKISAPLVLGSLRLVYLHHMTWFFRLNLRKNPAIMR